MRVQIFRTLHILLIGLAACLPTWAQDRSSVINSEKQAFRLVTLLNGLENPWSLAFLPDGRMLVTERAGRLRLLTQDFKLNPKPIEGLPEVVAQVQGCRIIFVNCDGRFRRFRCGIETKSIEKQYSN
jgi:glucose/arabinose dehydrogenase